MTKMNNKILSNMMKTAINKSDNIHTHSACAMTGKKTVTPYFANTNRTCFMKNVVGSVHAEMAVLNYMINTFFTGKDKQCLLQASK